jgi:hypothetical protein
MRRLFYLLDNKGQKISRNKLSKRFKVLIKPVIRLIIFFSRNELVVILSNGKAGSTSVMDAMNKAGIRTFQIHEVNADRISQKFKLNITSEKKSIPLHLLVSEVFVNSNKIDFKNVKFVLIYRNDSSQNLSALFQNYDLYKAEDFESEEFCKRGVNKINKDNIDWLEKTSNWLLQNAKDCNITILNYAESNEWSQVLSKNFNRGIVVLKKNVGANKFYSKQYNYMQKKIL